MKPAQTRRARRWVDWPCEKSYALSRRVHLDLFRRFRPALDCRLEVALERLELLAKLVRGSCAALARVERRIVERRHHARDLGFEHSHRRFRFFELPLHTAQLLASIGLRRRRNPLTLV